jgi:hypothetical protein
VAGAGLKDDDVPVRLLMSLSDAQRLGAVLVATRASASAPAMRELLWLRAVLIEQWRRTSAAERRRFEKRADSVLERFWTASRARANPSEAMNTVKRDDKP